MRTSRGFHLSWNEHLYRSSHREDEEKKPERKKGDGKVQVQVVDSAGDTIRTFTRKVEPGFNRFTWNLRQDGVSFPSRRERNPDADPPSGSQVAPGNENGLKLRIYGETGGLEWHQENPNHLSHSPFGQPTRIITRGGAGMNASVAGTTRIPPGHPEGYLEGFANLYSEIADVITARKAGQAVAHLIPTVSDGLAGMRFVDACVRSSESNSEWVTLVQP